MDARWQKIIRDAGLHRGRTLLVVLATALGLAAFSAVLAVYGILTRELDRGYRVTRPAAATLTTERLDDAFVALVRSRPGIADVDARRALDWRVRVGPNEWRNLRLFVLRDFADQRVSLVTPQQGAWPPASGEMLIERDALQVARAKIGESVTLETPHGDELPLRIAGTVHDAGQAQARMERMVYGYITLATLEELGEEPVLDQLKVVFQDRTTDDEKVRASVLDLQRWIEGTGRKVERVEIPPAGQHPHARLMALLLLVQAAFGFFALLLSGLLVVNLITALLARQAREIGIMKALGARTAQVAAVYLGGVVGMSAAALVVAVPIGTLGGRWLARWMAGFLNFDLASLAAPAWVYLLEVVAGVLVPLLAAARPIAKWSRVTVREALSDPGIASRAFGGSAFDRWLSGRTGRARPFVLSLRNTFRRRGRTALTVLTLAAGGTAFLAAFNVRASFIRSIDRIFDAFPYDLTLTLARPVPAPQAEAAFRALPGLARVEAVLGDQGLAESVHLFVQGRDPVLIERLKMTSEEALRKAGMRARRATSVADRRLSYDEHMRMVYVFLLAVAAIFAVVGGLGLATTMSLNVLDRRRELGVLRAIGARPAQVTAIVLGEAATISAASWVVAALAAWPVGLALGRLFARLMLHMDLDFVFVAPSLAVWLVLALAIALCASWLPARRAGRMSVHEAIGYE